MFQFTEISGENNYPISGRVIVNIQPNTTLMSMNLPLSGQISRPDAPFILGKFLLNC